MRVYATPWARAALGQHQLQLLHVSEPDDDLLRIIGTTADGPWDVLFNTADGRCVRTTGNDIIDTIIEALALANRALIDVVADV